MNNWMEKYERKKDETRERILNTKLEQLLNLLDETYKKQDRVKVIEKIVEVYDKLRIDACDYDINDYRAKKEELLQIKYEIMKEDYMESKESQSWNDYKKEELEEEEIER